MAAQQKFASVEVIRSARRTRSVSAHRSGDTLVIRMPAHFTAAQEKHWVGRMQDKVLAREAAVVSTDDDLAAWAELLSRQVLEPRLGWVPLPSSIRWVTNQHQRWGSCSTDSGQIRLSDRMRTMPQWVVAQVILHELGHLVHASHDANFKALVQHRDGERADAYLEGWSAGQRAPRSPDTPVA